MKKDLTNMTKFFKLMHKIFKFLFSGLLVAILAQIFYNILKRIFG